MPQVVPPGQGRDHAARRQRAEEGSATSEAPLLGGCFMGLGFRV